MYASAMLAAYGTGLLRDLKAVMKAPLREEVYLPDKERYEIYQKNKEIYVNLLEALGAFGEKERGE